MQPASAINRRPSHLPAGLQWRLTKVQHQLNGLLIAATGGWLGPHNRDFYVHHDESIRRMDPTWYRAKLLDNPFAAGWFYLPALEKLFDEHMSRKQDHSTRINNVVAFLAWRETAGI